MKNSRVFLFFLFVLFFISGASGLISEVTWNRMLVLVVGNTITATSLIVMAFMGGLCLGSYAGAWFFRSPQKRKPSVHYYAILEVIIGIYVLTSPFIFKMLTQMFVTLAPSLSSQPLVLDTFRFILNFLALTIPAFFMGATYPAIISSVSECPSVPRIARAGYFYSVNTLGAALGCFIAGYVLIPRWGAQASLLCAGLLNFLAAFGAMVLKKFPPKQQESEIVDKDFKQAVPVVPQHALTVTVAVITFFVGFVSLSYQVILTRIIISILGAEINVFTIVLTGFLIAMGLSALIVTKLQSVTQRIQNIFGVLLMIAGCLILIPPFMLIKICSSSIVTWNPHLDLTIVATIVAPVLLIGGLLPMAIKILETSGENKTVFNAGKLYAVNTLGGVLGAGMTNTFFVPGWGTQATLTVYAVSFLLMGLMVLWWSQKSFWKWCVWAMVGMALIFAIVSLPSKKIEQIYTSAVKIFWDVDENPQLALFKEGKAVTITVIDSPLQRERDFFLNGIKEASTRYLHVKLFKALGVLPVLFHEPDEPKDVLMVAFGAGISAGASLDTGLVRTLDVVDLNGDVEPINDLFREVNGDAFHDPRLHFIEQDGRNHLLLTPKKYSVIISDSTHPFSYDSWILYTKEFYFLVKSHLEEGGVFAQWLPLNLPDDYFRIFLNTVREVFPYYTFWNVYGSVHGFIVAGDKPFILDGAKLQQRLDRIPESTKLKDYELNRVEKIASLFVMDTEAIDEAIGEEARVNTDIFPYNQYFAFEKFVDKKEFRIALDEYHTSIQPYLKNVDQKQKQNIDELQAVARAMLRYDGHYDATALWEAEQIRPDDMAVLYNREVRYLLYPEMILKGEEQADSYNIYLENKTGLLETAIHRSPKQLRHYIDLAQLYISLDKINHAHGTLEKALEIFPNNIRLRNAFGDILMVKEDWGRAEEMFRSILEKNPKDFDVIIKLVNIFEAQEDYFKIVDLLQPHPQEERYWSEPMKAIYYEKLSKSFFFLGDYTNGEKYGLQSLEFYSGNHKIRMALARYYSDTAQEAAALTQLRKVLAVNPYFEEALDMMIAYYRQYGMEEEVQVLEQRLKRIQNFSSQ